MSVELYVYELKDEQQQVPQRVSWGGWQGLEEWLNEEGLDASGRMARHVQVQQVKQVLEETAGVPDEGQPMFVAPLPDLRGRSVMFGLPLEDADYVVAPVELTWLLAQSTNGWQASLTFSVERIGGRDSSGYFAEER
ncbi:MAG: hypothetical protein AB7Y46_15855 [Armatimonadota bacterium]